MPVYFLFECHDTEWRCNLFKKIKLHYFFDLSQTNDASEMQLQILTCIVLIVTVLLQKKCQNEFFYIYWVSLP